MRAMVARHPIRPSWSRRGLLHGLAGSLAAASAMTLRPRSAHAAEEKLLEQATSEYNTILVTERGSIRTMYFVVDGTRYIESRWDMANPNSLDLDYSRTMMAGFLVQPNPKRFMMMGVGGHRYR